LTEINHKVSLFAKWFALAIAAVFAQECATTSLRKLATRAGRGAFMQDAHAASRPREPQIPLEMLASVHELNRRFLDLVSCRPPGWSPGTRGSSAAVSAQVAPLSAAQKSAASNCPYALFDLRFEDGCHWQTRLRAVGHWNIADVTADGATLEFTRLALFFAWHVAATAKLAAQVLLGMQEATVAAFREAPIGCLPSLAASEAAHLTARWNDCARYWSALTEAASGCDAAELRRIQLSGLQLAAAARLA
jgi:hypothetical protein